MDSWWQAWECQRKHRALGAEAARMHRRRPWLVGAGFFSFYGTDRVILGGRAAAEFRAMFGNVGAMVSVLALIVCASLLLHDYMRDKRVRHLLRGLDKALRSLGYEHDHKASEWKPVATDDASSLTPEPFSDLREVSSREKRSSNRTPAPPGKSMRARASMYGLYAGLVVFATGLLLVFTGEYPHLAMASCVGGILSMAVALASAPGADGSCGGLRDPDDY